MAKSAAERAKKYRDEKRDASVTKSVECDGEIVTKTKKRDATNADTVTKTVTESEKRDAVTNEGVTEGVTKSGAVTGCQHTEIEVCESRAGKHLTYTKAGASLGDTERYKAGMVEPEMVRCPCCGKEWKCGRPDIQSAYCLKCEGVGKSWREREPYVRPQMESAERAMAALGVKG